MLPKGYGGRRGAGVNHSEKMEPQRRAQRLRRAILVGVVAALSSVAADLLVAHVARPWPNPVTMHALVFTLLTLPLFIFIRPSREGSLAMEPQPRAQGLRRAALAALGGVVVVVNWLVADWSVAHAARPWPSPAAMHTLVFVLLTLAFLIFISRRERKG
jgi:drug/metabolite transporter (DMT)-like permease